LTELGISKNGKRVLVDLIGSHAATHIKDEPSIEALLTEVIPKQVLTGDYLQYHIDMDREIGVTNCVATDRTDDIVWAKRNGRDGYTVFTKSRQSQPSSLLTVAFEKLDESSYKLVSTWIGEADSPSFPDTPRATPESKPYWSSHALVWGSQAVQPGTETKICPW